MPKRTSIAVVASLTVVTLMVAVAFLSVQNDARREIITSFDACAAAGGFILKTYPAQCETPAGERFTQDIGNALDVADRIRVATPRPSTAITSPLTITGEARGTWYFEATFPVRLADDYGTVLAEHYAQARGEWMTEDFVPFTATLAFTTPRSGRGTLILERSNPSGLPEHDAELRIPVWFNADAYNR